MSDGTSLCKPSLGISLLRGAPEERKERQEEALLSPENPLPPSVVIFKSIHTVVSLITFMPGSTKHSKMNLAGAWGKFSRACGG